MDPLSTDVSLALADPNQNNNNNTTIPISPLSGLSSPGNSPNMPYQNVMGQSSPTPPISPILQGGVTQNVGMPMQPPSNALLPLPIFNDTAPAANLSSPSMADMFQQQQTLNPINAPNPSFGNMLQQQQAIQNNPQGYVNVAGRMLPANSVMAANNKQILVPPPPPYTPNVSLGNMPIAMNNISDENPKSIENELNSTRDQLLKDQADLIDIAKQSRKVTGEQIKNLINNIQPQKLHELQASYFGNNEPGNIGFNTNGNTLVGNVSSTYNDPNLMARPEPNTLPNATSGIIPNLESHIEYLKNEIDTRNDYLANYPQKIKRALENYEYGLREKIKTDEGLKDLIMSNMHMFTGLANPSILGHPLGNMQMKMIIHSYRKHPENLESVINLFKSAFYRNLIQNSPNNIKNLNDEIKKLNDTLDKYQKNLIDANKDYYSSVSAYINSVGVEINNLTNAAKNDPLMAAMIEKIKSNVKKMDNLLREKSNLINNKTKKEIKIFDAYNKQRIAEMQAETSIRNNELSNKTSAENADKRLLAANNRLAMLDNYKNLDYKTKQAKLEFLKNKEKTSNFYRNLEVGFKTLNYFNTYNNNANKNNNSMLINENKKIFADIDILNKQIVMHKDNINDSFDKLDGMVGDTVKTATELEKDPERQKAFIMQRRKDYLDLYNRIVEGTRKSNEDFKKLFINIQNLMKKNNSSDKNLSAALVELSKLALSYNDYAIEIEKSNLNPRYNLIFSDRALDDTIKKQTESNLANVLKGNFGNGKY
ncbi:MAG: hypothetical protein QXL94_02885 [Candidatus Parvarchaeum sp.]